MGYIYQPAAGAPSTQRLAISMWGNVPFDADNILSLLSFGDAPITPGLSTVPGSPFVPQGSSVVAISSTDTAMTIGCCFSSALPLAVTVPNVGTSDPGSYAVVAVLFRATADGGASPGLVIPNTWNWIGVSIDVSAFRVGSGADAAGGVLLPSGSSGALADFGVRASFVLNGVDHSDAFTATPFVNLTESSGGGVTTSALDGIPGGIKLNGTSFGMPVAPTNLGFNFGAKIAEAKIWTDQYIDFTASRSLFFSSDRRPVPPAAAVAAFGRPAYHFQRNGKKGSGLKFSTNQGFAGAMRKVGTIGDFTPGP